MIADKGVPDLLIAGGWWPFGCLLGLELKAPFKAVKWSSTEQRLLWEDGRTAKAQSIDEVAFAIVAFESNALRAPTDRLCPQLLELARKVPKDRKSEVYARGF